MIFLFPSPVALLAHGEEHPRTTRAFLRRLPPRERRIVPEELAVPPVDEGHLALPPGHLLPGRVHERDHVLDAVERDVDHRLLLSFACPDSCFTERVSRELAFYTDLGVGVTPCLCSSCLLKTNTETETETE